MANLKLNNVVVVTESSGTATIQSGIFKASDGTSSVTIADSTGAVALAGTLGVTGATTLTSTLGVTGATTLSNTLGVTGETTAATILPAVDDTSDLGSAAKRWRNVYTTDLHLANDRGNWTVIEEEDYLTLRNNKTDKVYKLVMEEIE